MANENPNTPKQPPHKIPPEITILSDHAILRLPPRDPKITAPELAQDPDNLELQTKFGSAYDILRHKLTHAPMAVAVYGDWGTGKTSAMRWLKAQLEEWNKNPVKKGHAIVETVWFNPWKYHTREDVWRGLIAEVIIKCLKLSPEKPEGVVGWLKRAARQFGPALGRGFLSVLSNIEVSAKAESGGIGGAEIKLSGEAFREVVDEYNKAAHPQKAFLNEFEDTLRHWVSTFFPQESKADEQPLRQDRDKIGGPETTKTGGHETTKAGGHESSAPAGANVNSPRREPWGNRTSESPQAPAGATDLSRTPLRRLAIFIDDLDRCLPLVVLEVLEALKLYLDIPGLMFVVGLDRQVVDAVVMKHYADQGVSEKKSLQYLDKMFQVEIQASPTEKQARELFEKQIAEIDKASGKLWSDLLTKAKTHDGEPCRPIIEKPIAALCQHNPRTIKRMLNNILLRADSARRNEKLGGDEALRFAQGAQIALIQQKIRLFLKNSQDLFLRDDVHQWFDKWSKAVMRFPRMNYSWYRRYLQDEADYKPDPLAQTAESYAPKKVDDDTQMKRELDVLKESEPSYSEGATGLLDMEDLWNLMHIPFSADVASQVATVAPPPVPAKTKVPDPPGTTKSVDYSDLTQWPSFLLNAIAQSLYIPVDSLTPGDLKKLKRLDLKRSGIADLSPLANLSALTTLYLSGCTGIVDLKPLEKLTSLTTLSLVGCTGIKDLTPLVELTGLTSLYLNGCTGVVDLKTLEKLTSLVSLSLIDCAGAVDLKFLEELTSLETLYLSRCTAVVDLKPLEYLNWLTDLSLIDCTGVVDLKPLEKLAALKVLYLTGCTGVKDLGKLKDKKFLTIYGDPTQKP